MKSLYVDLDNNKLLAGPLNTLIASQQVFYSGNTETINIDLIQRDSNSNLLNYTPATGTTVSMVVGVPGTVVSIPAMTRTTQAGVTATATASLYSAITATGTATKYSTVTATVTASLFGNIRAQATAVVTRGTACTLSMTVVSVKAPIFSIGVVSVGAPGSYLTASTFNKVGAVKFQFGNADRNLPQNFIEIDDAGSGLYGSPKVFLAINNPTTARPDFYDVTGAFTFSNGKVIDVIPQAGGNENMAQLFENADFTVSLVTTMSYTGAVTQPLFNTRVSQGFVVVPDPDFIYCADLVTVACSGTGFPDGVNIPFLIPSDQSGDGLPCTGFMRAVNGSVVSVVSISSRGGRFTSSTTSGKTHGILPSFKMSTISVTCAGGGYWDSLPSVQIDDLYFDSAVAGAAPAVVSAVTVSGGSVSLILSDPGYGYTTAPNIRISAPRISDGLRTVTITNTPTGYADGIYGCTVSAPTDGATAAVNMQVSNGLASFSIINPGAGYVTAPLIACPAPNLGNSIQSITITCAGIGYTTDPTVTIYGAGLGATATAVIDANGSISSVLVVSSGSGYSGTATVGFSKPDNLGKVSSILVVTSGTNYTTPPILTFTGGGGAGLSATASVLNGGLSSIDILNEGSGYVTAPAITIDASPSRTIFSGVLTVTTSFVSSILPSTAVTVQINSASTIGTSTILQVQGAVAATI
jgi:hypothetical protein